MSRGPLLSIIIPVYNEEENVPILFNELTGVLYSYGHPYELIFIDDGSTDGTPKLLESIKGEKVHVELFEHNLGKSDALARGFSMAKGEAVITMDGDLQDDPAEIPRLVEALQSYDMVSGWRYERYDPLSKTIHSRIYNMLTRLITGVVLHDFNCGFKAYRREALKGLKLSRGFHRYIPVLLARKGCRVGEIKISHRPRLHGRSKYGALRILEGFVDLLRIRFFNREL
jgi:glycosyltransferase involved in cell wall biosynthesis